MSKSRKEKQKQRNKLMTHDQSIRHLQKRFLSRHNIILNKEKRLFILSQITSNEARLLSRFKHGAVLYKVF